MTERVVVTQGTYVASAVKPDQYPAQRMAEIVFIGRSNVGKSSLINSLTRRNQLARVSRQPGKTQTINFFQVGLKIDGEEARRDFYLVDLPGYGYAKTGKATRQLWQAFIREYLLRSPDIRFVCQLIDSRHDPMTSDVETFRWLVDNGLPVLVIATKTDKVGKSALPRNIAAIRRALGVPGLDILPYSSEKSEGRSELLDAIAASLIDYKA
ncbi:MAG: YihA family ribosome biogenesis GTP-binding protein [Schwartzia sp.]|nr:YihA family ribosome biogenesis GTP-binding protein [Schwartzia sp. (in: firmicutes)]